MIDFKKAAVALRTFLRCAFRGALSIFNAI